MTQLLAVFRSRAQATDCLTRLKARGITARLVSTPKEANIGCGLSVQFQEGDYPRVKALIGNHYSAFYGYLLNSEYYHKTYTIPK